MRRTVHDDWTVTALLAHLAFWDQSCTVRWDDYARGGKLVGISDAVIDVVNEANRPTWLALPGETAADLALAAAEEADARIARLSDDAVTHAGERGLRFMLDRSLHRTDHLDDIEQSLGW